MAEQIPVDRAAIYLSLCRRNLLRREARLPLLDLKAEYRRLVDVAKWRDIVDRHYRATRAEVLSRQRRRYGPDWGSSAGGRWATEILTSRLMRERFWL